MDDDKDTFPIFTKTKPTDFGLALEIISLTMKELHQKQWPNHKKYNILEDGVDVELKNQGDFTARLVKYEELGTDTSIANQKPDPWAIGFFISLFLNLLALVIIISESYDFPDSVMSGIAMTIIVPMSILGMLVFKYKKEKRLHGTEVYLPFDYSDKQKEVVDQFISELVEARRNYLRKKHMKIDDITPSESLKFTFQWLYNTDIITENELKDLLDKLEERKLIKGE